jgi:hypothetical protein
MSPLIGIYASQMTANIVQGSYDALASVTLSAATATVTFAGIPTGYKHLQVRALARTDRSANQFDATLIRVNSDTGSNYAFHRLFGTGGTVTSDASTSQTSGYAGATMGAGGIANAFSPFVVDVLDYKNSNKNKTLRSLSGRENNDADGSIVFSSSLWLNTAAITSINLRPSVGPNFVANSSFALYGVK